MPREMLFDGTAALSCSTRSAWMRAMGIWLPDFAEADFNAWQPS
jgi:hypothetical protein